MKNTLTGLLLLCAWLMIIHPRVCGAGSFDFNDGTTQGWTLDQMYVTSSQTKFTPVMGYTLMNSNNELSAYASALLIGRSDQNDIYLESPDLLSDASWQGIGGYSIDVRRLLYSPCWGDFANIFFVQLQLRVIDTADGNKEKLFAEHDGTNFVFHDIKTYNQLYQITWQPSWLADPRYKVKKIRIRITGPGDVATECWYRGSWNIDNVNSVGGSGPTASITVTSPNGGEIWQANTQHSITWTGQDIDNYDVKIEYSTNGGSSYTFVTYITNHGTSGSYNWMVPNEPSTNCLVRLSVLKTTTISDVSDAPFTIVGSTAGWVLTNNPIYGTVACFTVSGTNLFAGTQGGGVFLSTNNGVTWNAVNTGLTNYDVRGLCASGTNLFAGTWGGGVFISTNNGASWTAVNMGLSNMYVSSLYSSGTNLLAGTWGGVFCSTNNGTTWTAINTGLTETHIRAVYISGTNFFTGTINGLFLSTNNGTTWTAINSGLTNTAAISLAGIPAGGEEKLFTGTDGGGVFISTNNGANWTAVNTGLANLHIPFLAVSGTNLFAATWGGGVFLTTNNGASWNAVNEGLTNTNIRSLIVSGTDLFAGTENGGIWRRALSTMITAAPDIDANPTAWNYGAVNVGSFADKTFVISNTGTADLNVIATTLTGANAMEFSIQTGGGAFTLAPAASRNIMLRFAPTGAGSKSASLNIASNDPDENPLVIALSGQGGAASPSLSVNPLVLDFGTSATSLPFQISNTGGGTLTWNVTETPDKPWITSISPNNGTNNATVTVTVDRALLPGNNDTGVLAVTSNGGNQNVTVNISKQVITLPPSWNFTANTGNSAIVVLPTAANPNIDGVPLQSGDYIGVFTPAGLCCGWKQWLAANISITVWGDDDQTTPVDGFKANEELKYRVYRSSASKEWDIVTVAYSQGTGKYTKDAFMILSKFDVTEQVCRVLDFTKGWNMISINVTPADPNIAVVMASIASKLVIVKNSAGKTYIPTYGINDIGNMQFDNGYQAYVSDAIALNVCGKPVEPTKPISLAMGWSIISYLPAVPIDITTALAGISSKLVIAKNNAGQTYIPAYGINDIGKMYPGQGYQVYLNAAATLTYPASALAKATNVLAKIATEHFTYRSSTGENATVVVTTACNPRYSDGGVLENGDEIGVFTSRNLCCGAVMWDGTNKAITVWGDNSQTPEVDGFTAGDTLRFRVWKKSANTEYPAQVAFQPGQPVVYQANGFSVLTQLVAIITGAEVRVENSSGMPDEFRLFQNYPNPFNPATTIRFALPKRSPVTLMLFDVLGREVAILVDEELQPGEYKVVFEASDLSPGVYLYRLQAEGFSRTKKLTLMK
ncbi:MAG: choice-of-anchor D domain-containing protein [candidate division KSB1 bacterium]|nr:choice-of-anchor D domain-containing protein [candidate division KSB1 bacterium]MDZ7302354.1 choice-of-anchor D domain-containing protein [candidate division KSB1 bacterium]MDZ7311206.1 choice-of-anchor D domain-containing protein [candidate division KSB1 bacterium]